LVPPFDRPREAASGPPSRTGLRRHIGTGEEECR
jgi:hypothetical protein